MLPLTIKTDDVTSAKGHGSAPVVEEWNGLIKKPKSHFLPLFSPYLACYGIFKGCFMLKSGFSQKTWYFA